MKKKLTLIITLLTLLVSLNGCFWPPPWWWHDDHDRGRGGEHEEHGRDGEHEERR